MKERQIEMTAFLLSGTKNKSLSPTPMSVEWDTKRKASEPYIDVSGLEEEKFESAASEENSDSETMDEKHDEGNKRSNG